MEGREGVRLCRGKRGREGGWSGEGGWGGRVDGVGRKKMVRGVDGEWG